MSPKSLLCCVSPEEEEAEQYDSYDTTTLVMWQETAVGQGDGEMRRREIACYSCRRCEESPRTARTGSRSELTSAGI